MNLRRIFLVSSIAVTITCKPPPPKYGKTCHHTIGYTIDTEFTDEQMATVISSFNLWQEGSKHLVCFIQNTGGLVIHRATDPVEVAALERRGFISNGTNPELLVGLASYPNAWIITGKLNSNHELFATVTHEIGHLLHLDHFEPPNWRDEAPTIQSWMYPNIQKAPDSRFLPQKDIDSLILSERDLY